MNLVGSPRTSTWVDWSIEHTASAIAMPIPPSRIDIDAVKATYGLKAFTERVLPSQPDAEFA